MNWFHFLCVMVKNLLSHVVCIYSCHMLYVFVLVTCCMVFVLVTCCMYLFLSHVVCICSCHMLYVFVHVTCCMYLFMSHVVCICSCHMLYAFVLWDSYTWKFNFGSQFMNCSHTSWPFFLRVNYSNDPYSLIHRILYIEDIGLDESIRYLHHSLLWYITSI